MAQEATPAPVQIFAIVKGGLTFHKEALREIINKIPKDQKVAIVSVNGAFRTGKSFLLNTFLRCLQHGNTAYREKDWLGGEVNASLLPGHPERPAQNTSGFEWRGGQGGVTTGIWMWSEPLELMISNQDSPRLVSVLLMDTQGLDDTRMSQDMNNAIFAMSTLMSSYQIYNVSGRIAENNISNLAVFSVFAASARVNEAEATSARVNETKAKQFQIIEFLVRDCTFIEDGMTPANIASETADQLSLVRVGGDGTPATAPDPAAEGQMITREQINQCFKEVDCFLLPHPGLGVASPTYQGDLSVMNSFFRDRLIAYTNHVFSNLQPKIINERELSASELLAFIECYAAAFSNSGNYVSLVQVNIFNATIDAFLSNAYKSSLEMYENEMNRAAGDIFTTHNRHKTAASLAADKFSRQINVLPRQRVASETREFNLQIQKYAPILANVVENCTAMTASAQSKVAENVTHISNCSTETLNAVVETITNAVASAQSKVAESLTHISNCATETRNAVVQATAKEVWEWIHPYLAWAVTVITLCCATGVLFVVVMKAELIISSSILLFTAFGRIAVACILVFIGRLFFDYCVWGYYTFKYHLTRYGMYLFCACFILFCGFLWSFSLYLFTSIVYF